MIETYHTFFEEYLHHYLPLLPRAVARALRAPCLAPAVQRRRRRRRAVAAARRRARGYGVTRPIRDDPDRPRPRTSSQGGDGGAFRARHGIARDRPVMLLVGRVAHEKNIGFLLDVLAEVRRDVPNVLFVIAGEGPR